jgi:tetratricopeptide (TPR) repeat protein
MMVAPAQRKLAAIAAAAAAALLVADARAQPAPTYTPRVQRVRELYERLYYAEAAKVCESALRLGGNPLADHVFLLGFQGLIAAAQGKHMQAVAVFKRMLAIDPRARLGRGQAPRIVAAYSQAQRWIAERSPIALGVSAPRSTLRGAALELSAVVGSDPLALVHNTVLYLRAAGERSWEERPAEPGARGRWTVDLALLPGAGRASSIEYIVAAVDRQRNEVALAGKPNAPLAVRLEGSSGAAATSAPASAPATPQPAPGPRFSVLRAWWFWTAIGVATTGMAVGIGLAASSRADTITAPVTVGVR